MQGKPYRGRAATKKAQSTLSKRGREIGLTPGHRRRCKTIAFDESEKHMRLGHLSWGGLLSERRDPRNNMSATEGSEYRVQENQLPELRKTKKFLWWDN